MLLKIRDDFNLTDLEQYGFHNNANVWIYDIEEEQTKQCSILVNDIDHDDRVVRFYYQDDLEDIEVEDNIILDCIDYDVPVPHVIFQLIRDDIIIEVEE